MVCNYVCTCVRVSTCFPSTSVGWFFQVFAASGGRPRVAELVVVGGIGTTALVDCGGRFEAEGAAALADSAAADSSWAVRCLPSSASSRSSIYFPREARLDVVGTVSSSASASEVTGASTTQFQIFPRDFPPSPASELGPAPTPLPSTPPT